MTVNDSLCVKIISHYSNKQTVDSGQIDGNIKSAFLYFTPRKAPNSVKLDVRQDDISAILRLTITWKIKTYLFFPRFQPESCSSHFKVLVFVLLFYFRFEFNHRTRISTIICEIFQCFCRGCSTPVFFNVIELLTRS